MIKWILAFFIVICPLYDTAVAAPIRCTESPCPAGCMIGNTGCTACPNGQYSATSDATSCIACTIPTGATALGPGTSAKTCPWQLTCEAGTYFNETGCAPCNKHETSDKHTITYTDNRWPKDTCRAKVYKLTIKNTCPCGGNDLVYYYEYNRAWSTSETGPFNTSTGDLNNRPNISCTNHTLKFNTPSGRIEEIDQDTMIETVWSPKTFDVRFENNIVQGTNINANECPTGAPGRSFLIQCRYGEECPTTKFNFTQCWTLPGLDISEWQCENNINIQPGAPIKIGACNEISELTCSLQTEDCPAGHYCSYLNKVACPAGMTSAAKSENIDKCQYKSDTKFCDGAGNCFTLSGGITSLPRN